MNSYQKMCSALLLLICAIMLSCTGEVQRNTAGTGSGKQSAKVLVNDFQLTGDPSDQSQPAVAYDSINHNRYLSVFVDDRNGSQIPRKLADAHL